MNVARLLLLYDLCGHTFQQQKSILSSNLDIPIPFKGNPGDFHPLCDHDSCRVFLNTKENIVYKLYDSNEFCHNYELIQQWNALPEVSLSELTKDGRILLLKYKYIVGSHHPSNLAHFIGPGVIVSSYDNADATKTEYTSDTQCSVIYTYNAQSKIEPCKMSSMTG